MALASWSFIVTIVKMIASFWLTKRPDQKKQDAGTVKIIFSDFSRALEAKMRSIEDAKRQNQSHKDSQINSVSKSHAPLPSDSLYKSDGFKRR
ncbi:MAG: hypothetical protein OIF58_02780 [Cohaesibacter sp.]|nr:hypothetical protein [Cohaesibacter sp.]